MYVPPEETLVVLVWTRMYVMILFNPIHSLT